MRHATSDWTRVLVHFIGFIAIGYGLFLLCSALTGCDGTPAQIKSTGHLFGELLPPPLGWVADSLATIIATFAAYKGTRHVHRRLKAKRDAKAALHAGTISISARGETPKSA